MLVIDESLYFSKGTTRKCFIHPTNENLCIKLSLKDQGKRTPGIIKAIDRENAYYLKLTKRNISWSHLSQYCGDIVTNLGKGSIYQLIRDHDGKISTSLDKFLEKVTVPDDALLGEKLQTLYNYMQDNSILTTSLLARNIVVQKGMSDYELIIIDDIGNSEFVPVSEFSNYFASRKIKRKWQRFLKKIDITIPL